MLPDNAALHCMHQS